MLGCFPCNPLPPNPHRNEVGDEFDSPSLFRLVILFPPAFSAINGSCRFAVPPVQSVNFASASVAVSGEQPREDLGLNARSEGEELSNKDGDERANALRRWLRGPRLSARIQVHGVGWHARVGGEWKGNCIIFSRQMQTRAGAIESVHF